MKLAVTGKGGVGKTTVCGLLARTLHEAGHRVIAIDVDPDSNLAACLGYPHPERIAPLVTLKDLIEERTGAKPGSSGGMFRLNPFVEDIPEQYAVEVDGVRVLVAGAVKEGGAGCYCPENALVRALISHLLLDEDVALVLDMEAGIEHLGRGTVRAVDQLIIVVEPSRRSVETALRIHTLAADLDLPHIAAIGNKIRDESDTAFLKEALPQVEFLAFIPYDDNVRKADMEGGAVSAASVHTHESIRLAVRNLESRGSSAGDPGVEPKGDRHE